MYKGRDRFFQLVLSLIPTLCLFSTASYAESNERFIVALESGVPVPHCGKQILVKMADGSVKWKAIPGLEYSMEYCKKRTRFSANSSGLRAFCWEENLVQLSNGTDAWIIGEVHPQPMAKCVISERFRADDK